MSLTVELTPQLEKHVRDKVKSGAYRSASEYIREAIRLKQREERYDENEWLRREVRKGFDQLDRSESVEYDDKELRQLFANIAEQGAKPLTKTARVPRKKSA
jgi:putative addiction module CopG family antidote